MQIKPDIGSLPCLSVHFRVTIRVLLITHKAPGNLTSLTFFPGTQLQGPLHQEARSQQKQTADRAVNISSMFHPCPVNHLLLIRVYPGHTLDKMFVTCLSNKRCTAMIMLIQNVQLHTYVLYVSVHTYCISYSCITSRYPCGLISQKRPVCICCTDLWFSVASLKCAFINRCDSTWHTCVCVS